MNASCFRCDWEGDTESKTCPRCGAPLYRAGTGGRERRAAAQPDAAPPSPAGVRGRGSAGPGPPDVDRPPSEPQAVTTSARSVFVLVGVVFSVVVFLLVRGGSPDEVPPSDAGHTATGGVLVYAVPDGKGAARLWRWDLTTDETAKGPLIREPLALVNVRSSRYGWLGLTSDLGNGVLEASVLDSLDVEAEVASLGRGDIVTWVRQGASVVFVDRGPLLDGCRREVSVTAVTVGFRGREVVLDDTICGDVLSAGRTSLGYFVTRQRLGGVDVVGTGYSDAGVLLRDYGVIAIAPGGDMLVTPSDEFLPAIVPTRPSRGDYDPPPLRVAGAASHFAQFGGRPVPYLVRGIPLRVEEVLGYAPGVSGALVVGRLGGDRPALWELPLEAPGTQLAAPRYVADVAGFTAAAYAENGTGFVVTDGRLWRLVGHGLTPLDVPEGAPIPTGPIAWIVREPVTPL